MGTKKSGGGSGTTGKKVASLAGKGMGGSKLTSHQQREVDASAVRQAPRGGSKGGGGKGRK